MADQQANCKRDHESDNNQPNDNKMKSITMKKKEKAKTITNICYEMVDRIFDFLDLESLLNVAQTCKRLQIAAAAKFGDEYGKNPVYLHPSVFWKPSGIYMEHPLIQVAGLKFCLPFLRCFGSRISVSEINYRYATDTRSDHFDHYVNRYCADTLTSISFRSFWNKQTIPFDAFSKPFKNITKVELRSIDLGNKFPKFVNLFPNLRRLDMTDIEIDETAIAVSFPHLKHLSLYIYDKNRKNVFTNENVVNFLHVNRQLQTLNIHSRNRMTLDELSNAISENQSILKLNLFGNIADLNGFGLCQLVKKLPLLEKLVVGMSKLPRGMASMLLLLLNEINCDGKVWREVNNGYFLNQIRIIKN